MSYWGKYVSVAKKRKRAERKIKRMKKAGKLICPVEIKGNKIAESFWGKAWCVQLEEHFGSEGRLSSARSCVRHGLVIDLQIRPGEIKALVDGSSLYEIEIKVAQTEEQHWAKIARACNGQVQSFLGRLQGDLSERSLEILCDPEEGLLLGEDDLECSCTCPDWDVMCKHIIAALYGVGVRLDEDPTLLFTLRQVDSSTLLTPADFEMDAEDEGDAPFEDGDLSALFGIEMIEDEEEKEDAPRSMLETFTHISQKVGFLEVLEASLFGQESTRHAKTILAMLLSLFSSEETLEISIKSLKNLPLLQAHRLGLSELNLSFHKLISTFNQLGYSKLSEVFLQIAFGARSRVGVEGSMKGVCFKSVKFVLDDASEKGLLTFKIGGKYKNNALSMKLAFDEDGVPIWMSTSQNSYAPIWSFMKCHEALVRRGEVPCFLMDYSLYTKDELPEYHWISRVSEAIEVAQELIIDSEFDDFEAMEEHAGYGFIEIDDEEDDSQRWVLFSEMKPQVHLTSEQAEACFEQHQQAQESITALRRRLFESEQALRSAMEEISAAASTWEVEFTVQQLQQKSGRDRQRRSILIPSQQKQRTHSGRNDRRGALWRLGEVKMLRNSAALYGREPNKNMFILATNLPDEDSHSPSALLSLYRTLSALEERELPFLKRRPITLRKGFVEGLSNHTELQRQAIVGVLGFSELFHFLVQEEMDRCLKESLSEDASLGDEATEGG